MEVMTNGRDKYRSRENRRLVRELFMRVWDPIGVRDVTQAQDEYDAYVAKAYVMLVDETATVDDLARYLASVEDYMGLPATTRSAERCRRVAEALVALKPSLVITH
jgi:hypothetical protein